MANGHAGNGHVVHKKPRTSLKARARCALAVLLGRAPAPAPVPAAVDSRASGAVDFRARRNLQLSIIENILREPGYLYDTGMEADYTTPLTDLVHHLASHYRATTGADPDESIETLLEQARSKNPGR